MFSTLNHWIGRSQRGGCGLRRRRLACIETLEARTLLSSVQRPLTFSEMGTIDATMPLLKIVTAAPRTILEVQVDYEGKGWEQVYRGDATDANGYVILLDDYPDHVRAGLTGYFQGSLGIDAIQLIKPNGAVQTAVNPQAVNSASGAGNVLALDGLAASMSHSAETQEATDRFDGVEVDFAYAGGKPTAVPIPRPQVAQPPGNYGLYAADYAFGDPYFVPPGGFSFSYNVDAVARYDFSIMQKPDAASFARIEQMNPNHRIILRGQAVQGDFLGYFYDAGTRAAKRQAALAEIASCGPYLHGYTFFEEELQHTALNWYSPTPQAWATNYTQQYEQETGKTFVWQSDDLKTWLAGKIKFFYNDMYDVIKQQYPKLKLYPWTYVPGDISGWGWIDPAQLKSDGWIYQWYDTGDNYLQHDAVRNGVSIGKVWVGENYIQWGINKLRQAGIPNDEIYVQVWGFTPSLSYDSMEGTAQLRSAGVQNIFNFYYGGMPTDPPLDANTSDLYFEVRGAAEGAGTTVSIGNPGFETGAHTYPTPWEWGGPAQVYQSTTFGTAPPPDGSSWVAGMSNSTGGPHPGLSDVEQTLSALAAPNTRYMLTVDVVNSNGTNPAYPIKLVPLLRHADGTALGGAPGGGASTPSASVTLLSASWRTETFTWTTDGTEAGTQLLRLGFKTDNSQAGGTLFFDNAHLVAAPIIATPPTISQLNGDVTTSVGAGLTQSFVAPSDSLASIEIKLASTAAVAHQVTIEASDRGGVADGVALRTVSLAAGTGPGIFSINGIGVLFQTGKRYWVTIRPQVIGQSTGLTLAGSGANPYPDGEMLKWEGTPGSYFNGWRATDPNFIFGGVGGGWSWPSSYQERLRFETLVTDGRDLPVVDGSFEAAGYPYPSSWSWKAGTSQQDTAQHYGGPVPPDGSTYVASTSGPSTGISVSQILPTWAKPNTTYTLTVDARNANGANPSYPQVVNPYLLHADGTPLSGASVATPVSASLTVVPWHTFQFTWTTDGTEPGTQALKIGFGPSATKQGTIFIDNVRLVETPVVRTASIGNFSFEEDTAANAAGELSDPGPWHWDLAAAHAYSNLWFGPNGVAPTSNGSWAAGMDTGGNSDSITQTLTTLAAPNTTYTVTVDIAAADAAQNPGSVQVALRHADGTALNGTTIWRTSPQGLASDSAWHSYTATWTTDGTEAGYQFLQLAFKALGYNGSAKVFVDDVRLVVPAVQLPPGTWQTPNSGNWSTPGNWSDGIIPNAVGAPAKFLGVIDLPRTISTNIAVTVGATTFDNASTYVIAGAGSLTVAVSSGSGSISVLQGSHKINLPLTFASNTDLAVASGASLTIGNPTTINADTTVTKTGNLLIQAPLTIKAGGALVLASGPTTAFGAPSLASGARIDVKSNAITIDYSGQSSPAATIKAQLSSGYASGAWNGSGINTSSAVANQTALGWKDDAASQSILVKHTYYGDTNLDGQVDISDLGRLATNWQANAAWSGGDFNYDGFVDISDLGLLATNWQAGVGNPLGRSLAAAQVLAPLVRRPKVAMSESGSMSRMMLSTLSSAAPTDSQPARSARDLHRVTLAQLLFPELEALT